MELDPRIKAFKLDFPIKESASGLKPTRTYFGRVFVEVTEPIAVSQLKILFEGWERVDFGAKIGATRKLLFRSTADLLQTEDKAVDMIAACAAFDFSCTLPNVNFPSAMRSAICEVAYTISASLVGAGQSPPQMLSPRLSLPPGAGTLAREGEPSSANHAVPLAFGSLSVQLAPRVLPSGVGWLKPLVMRDGIMLSEPVKRRFRRQNAQTAMNICVHVKNHCCTLGESIMVDVDATMLQKDRVLTFVRAAVIEQVALKTNVHDARALESINAFLKGTNHDGGSTVILAERTLNRKVSELDPNTLSKEGGASGADQPIAGLSGLQNLRIRVPRKNVCTAEGFFLSFSHVLRLTFGLSAARPLNGNLDTKYATKDIPLRLVTSKFGDVGHASQVEINKRLSALTTESDGTAVSEAYGYLLSENSRVERPEPLVAYVACEEVPGPLLDPVIALESEACAHAMRPVSAKYPASPLSPLATESSVCSPDQSSFKVPTSLPSPSPSPSAPQLHSSRLPFQYGPLPPIPDMPSGKHHSMNACLVRTRWESPVSPARPVSVSHTLSALASAIRPASVDDNAAGIVEGHDSDAGISTQSPDTAEESSAYTTTPELLLSIERLNSRISLNLPPEHDAGGSPQTIQAAFIKSPADDGNKGGAQTLAVSDKRESSRSEGETIVYSPSEIDDIADFAIIDDMPTRSNTPDPKYPKLPSLPTMEPLDSMTKDLFNSSAVFVDDFDFSSYWKDSDLN